MTIVEWFVITLQYTIRFRSLNKGLKIYPMMKKEEVERNIKGLPPFEDTWFFQIKAFFWRIKHKYLTDYSAKEVVDAYYNLIQTLVIRSENEESLKFASPYTELRLAGGTIIIDEKWAINGNGKGIYVHKRESPTSDWFLVYRTNTMLKDYGFIKQLDTASRADALFSPVTESSTTDNKKDHEVH